MNYDDPAAGSLELVRSTQEVPLLGSLRWVLFGLIHLLASVLAYWPTFFLWYGVLAVGARAGWWAGEPTANDGEEYFSLPLGLVGWGLVMGLTAALVTWLVRPLKATPLVLAGWLLLIVVQIVVWSAQMVVLSVR